jgi:hypothetical protein
MVANMALIYEYMANGNLQHSFLWYLLLRLKFISMNEKQVSNLVCEYWFSKFYFFNLAIIWLC